MKWCATCECEYVDEAEVCSDCGQPLVEFKEKLEEPTAVYEYQDYVLLKSCVNNFEADLLVSFLASNDILSDLRFEGSGSYLNIIHGVNYQGVNVMVLKEDFEDAQTVLNEFKYAYDEEEQEEQEELEIHRKKKQWISYLIMIGMIGPLVIAAVASCIIIFQSIG